LTPPPGVRTTDQPSGRLVETGSRFLARIPRHRVVILERVDLIRHGRDVMWGPALSAALRSRADAVDQFRPLEAALRVSRNFA